MRREALPNPADSGYPYNPEAAAWLANYYSQSFGGGGGGNSSWVNSYLDYSHSCFENGYESSISDFNNAVNTSSNSGSVKVQTGIMDYYTFTSTDGGKTWHQGNYINSEPIYSTINIPQGQGDGTSYAAAVGLASTRLATGWVVAGTEPTPVGEVVMGVATLATAAYIVHANSRNSQKPNIVYEIYSYNSITGY